MSPVRKRKPMNRKRYVKSEKAKKRRAKGSSEEDMNQNFRIKQVEKKVSSLVKSTRNYFKVASGSTTISTIVGLTKNANMANTNQVVDLNVLGSTVTRTGAHSGVSAIWKHIDLAYYINQDPLAETADVGTSTVVRVMLFCIHKPTSGALEASATLPSFAEIFADNDADASAMISSDILRPYNRLNRQGFEVLYDKFHVLVPTQMAVTTAGNIPLGNGNLVATQPIRVQLFPSKKSQLQTFNNYDADTPSTGDYTYIQQNQYWLAFFTDNADNAVPPTITYNVTVDYLE